MAETDTEQYVQGLIQLAAAYHHVKRGTFRGAVRLFDAALGRLGRFPTPYCGLDLTDVASRARDHREWTASRLERSELDQRLDFSSYPRLVLLTFEVSPMPPSCPW